MKEDQDDSVHGEGLGDSAIDMLGKKIDNINSSLANSSLDTDDKEKQLKKVDSRKSVSVYFYESIFTKESRFGLILGRHGRSE